MSTSTEERIILEALETIKAEGVMSEEARSGLAKAFGTRFENALRAVEDGKVRRFLFVPSRRVVWLVSGRERDYLILPRAGFCSCEDFYFRVISHEEFLCYHLLAQRLAEAVGRYASIDESDDRYEEVALRVARQFERPRKLPIKDVENIRRVVAGILSEEKTLPLERLLEEVHGAGFPDLGKRHLVAILVADKARRFHSVDGIWEMRSDSKPHE